MATIVFWIRVLAGGVIFAATLFIIGFIAFANTIERGQAAAPEAADGIVVMTGGRARISEAIKLLAAGKAKRLLISGVHAGTTRDELIRLSPQSADLFQCCIDLDKRAQNTTDNAAETRNWARTKGFGSLIVVTSSYHIPRTLVELRRVMPAVSVTPYPVVPSNFKIDAWWAYPGTLRLVFSEYVKYLAALARLFAERLVGPDPSPVPTRQATSES